jgi:peptidoglycan/LPS O-acetylase OafA/YrhL
MLTLGAPDLNGRLFLLDALRGLAAIVVVVWHLEEVQIGQNYLAVDFFFVLSGFVIAKSYEEKILRGLTIKNFLYLRLLRLYPLYLIGFILGLVTFNISHHIFFTFFGTGFSMIFGLFVLPAIGQNQPFPFNGVSWSLFLELFINIIFCFYIVRQSTKKLIIAVSFVAFLIFAAAIIIGHLNIGWNWKTFIGGFPRVLYGFTVGVIFWRIRTYLTIRPSWLGFIWAACLLFVLAAQLPKEIQGISSGVSLLLLMPLFVWLGTESAPKPKWKPICAFLGDISYPLYIIHGPLLNLDGPLKHSTIPVEIWKPAVIAILIFISWVLARYIDAPARRLFEYCIGFVYKSYLHFNFRKLA